MEIGMKAFQNQDEVGAAAVPYLRVVGHLVYAYFFAQMAKIGGGRYYLITDARKLPAVFAQETILAARSSIREEEYVPKKISDSSSTKGVVFADDDGPKPLLGYVVTQLKPRAQRMPRSRWSRCSPRRDRPILA